jgi:hypothetical protein
VPSGYSGWTCSLCGGWITENVFHSCPGLLQQAPSVWVQPNYDPLILAELQAIRALLEKMAANDPKAEIKQRIEKTRESIERLSGARVPGERFHL